MSQLLIDYLNIYVMLVKDNIGLQKFISQHCYKFLPWSSLCFCFLSVGNPMPLIFPIEYLHLVACSIICFDIKALTLDNKSNSCYAWCTLNRGNKHTKPRGKTQLNPNCSGKGSIKCICPTKY